MALLVGKCDLFLPGRFPPGWFLPAGSSSVNSSPVGSYPVGSYPVGPYPAVSYPVGSYQVGSSPVGFSPSVGPYPVGFDPVGSFPVVSYLVSPFPMVASEARKAKTYSVSHDSIVGRASSASLVDITLQRHGGTLLVGNPNSPLAWIGAEAKRRAIHEHTHRSLARHDYTDRLLAPIACSLQSTAYGGICQQFKPSLAYSHRLLTPIPWLWRPQADSPMITPVACLRPSPDHFRGLPMPAEGRSAHGYTHRMPAPIACLLRSRDCGGRRPIRL